MGSRKEWSEMPGRNRTRKDHRFAVEDLLDLYTRGHSPNGAGVMSKTTGREKAGTENPTDTSALRVQDKQSAATRSGKRTSACGADGEGMHE
jgi:hypothetical protein